MPTTITTNNKTKLVPKLRFKGFEEEWEKKELKDFTKINQGLQIAISERFLEKVDGSYFYITNEFLRAGSKKSYFIKNPPQSVMCDEDDLLMTRTGNTGQVVTGVSGAFHNNFFKIKFDSSCAKWFLYYFLTDHKTQHTILKLAGTSTIPDLNHGDFYKIKINFPSFLEQQKIATFLSSVDEKLQQLTRKKELLEHYKKGVMQQLFSGKLRFKDDTSTSLSAANGKSYPEWEEKRLGDCLDYIQPTKYLVSSTEYDDSYTTPVLTAGKTFILGYTNETNNIFNENLPVILFDDFTTATQFVDFPFKAKSSAMKILVAKENENINYIYEAMRLIKFEIGGHGRHWISQFANFMIPYPCLPEQQKIANYLTSIDKKIETIKKEITATQGFKKGLLQQMFV